jgi:hypothetical protein
MTENGLLQANPAAVFPGRPHRIGRTVDAKGRPKARGVDWRESGRYGPRAAAANGPPDGA